LEGEGRRDWNLRVVSNQRIHAGNYRKCQKGNPDDETLKRPARSEPKDKSQTVSTVGARQEGIATAACYRAQRRGFSPGGGFIDWLEAEWQINAAVK